MSKFGDKLSTVYTDSSGYSRNVVTADVDFVIEYQLTAAGGWGFAIRTSDSNDTTSILVTSNVFGVPLKFPAVFKAGTKLYLDPQNGAFVNIYSVK